MTSLQSLIPKEKLKAVEKALLQAFKTTNAADAEPLTGGLSTSLVYKFTSNNKAYVLRVIMRTDHFKDPAHLIACTQSAARMDIAPPVYYTNVADGILITGFIKHTNLRVGFSSIDLLLQELARTVKTIHAAPAVQKGGQIFDKIDLIRDQFIAFNVLPGNISQELFGSYDRIRKHYLTTGADIVFSHNDLNPGNILFDNEKIWIIDWDAAFMNDRYVDLAIVANAYVSNRDQEAIFLEAYFDRAPGENEFARFFLMRQICYLLHSTLIFNLAMETKPANVNGDINEEALGIHEIGRRLSDGSLSISSYEGKYLYAKALMNEAIVNMRSARFEEAIGFISSLC